MKCCCLDCVICTALFVGGKVLLICLDGCCYKNVIILFDVVGDGEGMNLR